MPPVHRFARSGSRVRVPADLPDAARWAMDGYIEPEDMTYGGGNTAEEWFGKETITAFRRLRPLARPYADGTVRANAGYLCLVRNLLDLEVLNGERECDYYAEHDGVQLDEHGCCLECHWCRCIVLRDRMDFWLDKGGFPKNAYIYDLAYDVEATWRKVYGGVAT